MHPMLVALEPVHFRAKKHLDFSVRLVFILFCSGEKRRNGDGSDAEGFLYFNCSIWHNLNIFQFKYSDKYNKTNPQLFAKSIATFL